MVECRGEYDAAARSLHAAREAVVPADARARTTKEPFVIPLAVGLVGADGRDMPLAASTRRRSSRARARRATTAMLALTQRRADASSSPTSPSSPVPSLLRGFSAPVRVKLRLQRRRARAPHGARLRRVQSLGGRPGARDAHPARRRRERSAQGREMTVPDDFVEAMAPRARRRLARSGVRRRGAAAALAKAISPNAWTSPIRRRSTSRACSFMRDIATRYRTRFEGAFRHFTVRRARTRPMPPPPAAARCATPRSRYIDDDRRRAPRARSRSSNSAAPRT